MAVIGSRSLQITKIITKLPTSLVSRLKAMVGKSDQKMLNTQYVMKRSTGQQRTRHPRTLGRRLSSIVMPRINKTMQIPLSMGLPSEICVDMDRKSTVEVASNHLLNGREHASMNHVCGIQRAREPALPFRSNQKRPAIPMQQMMVASVADSLKVLLKTMCEPVRN